MALNTFLLVSAFLLVVLSCSHTVQSKQTGQLFNFIKRTEGSLSQKGQDISELHELKQYLKELGCSGCNHPGIKVGEEVEKNEFDHLLDSYESNCYLQVTRIFGLLLIIWNLL
jgi:hypothetical protein